MEFYDCITLHDFSRPRNHSFKNEGELKKNILIFLVVLAYFNACFVLFQIILSHPW